MFKGKLFLLVTERSNPPSPLYCRRRIYSNSFHPAYLQLCFSLILFVSALIHYKIFYNVFLSELNLFFSFLFLFLLIFFFFSIPPLLNLIFCLSLLLLILFSVVPLLFLILFSLVPLLFLILFAFYPSSS